MVTNFIIIKTSLSSILSRPKYYHLLDMNLDVNYHLGIFLLHCKIEMSAVQPKSFGGDFMNFL